MGGFTLKKRIIAAAIFILAVLVGSIIYINVTHKRIIETEEYKTANITEIGEFQITDITKISFQYDNPSLKGETVENKEKIKEFMNYINNCRFTKMPKQIPMTGYYQLIVLFAGDKRVMDIMTYDSFVNINGTEYKMVKNNINQGDIDNFVKSAK
ncbi:MAG: cell wall-binding protein [Clostridiaceae bacterium]|jgi:hypothetical protein|nr:cell wall-binding protein [Clostridiaceae bacterium]